MKWIAARLAILAGFLLLAVGIVAILATLLWQVWGLVLAGAIALMLRAGVVRVGDWTHGTAAWATVREMDAAGMHDGAGLILGESEKPGAAVGDLLSLPLDRSELAVRRLLGQRELLRLPRHQNILCVAPTGAGKGVSLVIPWLLEYAAGSCVVLDLKGELYEKTAAYRRDVLGQKIVRLDPFKVCGEGGDSFNPLDLIVNGPEAVDAARAMAEAMVVRSGHESDPHWNDQSANILTALTALVLAQFAPTERNLATVRELMSIPKMYARAVQMMCESGGILRRLAGLLMTMEAKELAGVLSTATRHSTFLDSPAIEAISGFSTFDARALLGGGTTLYIILPPDQMEAQSRWLRLVISSLIRLIGKEGTGKECFFLLDEAGQLGGDMPALEQGLTLLRARGLKMALFYQSTDQVKATFQGKESLLYDNCDTRIFFGVNSLATAEMVSNMLGETTISVTSFSDNDSRGWQEGGHHGEVNVSRGSSRSVQAQARRLLKPEEVLAMDGMDMIVFTRGVRPILGRRVLYYQHPRYMAGSLPPGFDWLLMFLCLAAVALVWVFLRQV